MATQNITTTTRRIVLALGIATAAVVAIPSTQEAHAADAKPAVVTPSSLSERTTLRRVRRGAAVR